MEADDLLHKWGQLFDAEFHEGRAVLCVLWQVMSGMAVAAAFRIAVSLGSGFDASGRLAQGIVADDSRLKREMKQLHQGDEHQLTGAALSALQNLVLLEKNGLDVA